MPEGLEGMSAVGAGAVREDAGAEAKALIEQLTESWFSGYGPDRPPETCPYYLYQELKMHGYELPDAFGLATQNAHAAIGKEDTSELAREFERQFTQAARRPNADTYPEYVEKSDGLVSAMLHRGEATWEIGPMDRAQAPGAALVYDVACAETAGKVAIAPGADVEEVYRQIAKAGPMARHVKSAIYKHATGETSDDAFYSRMGAYGAELRETIGNGPALDVMNDYLEAYNDEAWKGCEPMRREAQERIGVHAQATRFPHPAQFNVDEINEDRYVYMCENGMKLEIAKAGTDAYTWMASRAGIADGTARINEHGIAATYEQAYSDMYKKTFESFSGIVDPDNPKLGAVNLGKLMENPKNMAPPMSAREIEQQEAAWRSQVTARVERR